jgi:hypothetical protein
MGRAKVEMKVEKKKMFRDEVGTENYAKITAPSHQTGFI